MVTPSLISPSSPNFELTVKSTGRIISTFASFAAFRISGTSFAPSSSNSEAPMFAPPTLAKVNAILPPKSARGLHVVTFADHRRVRTVRRAERIVHVNIRQRRQALAERGSGLRARLDLVAVRVRTLALLLCVEAQVLQQNDRSRSRIGASGFDFRPDAKELKEAKSHRERRERSRSPSTSKRKRRERSR